MFGTKGDIRFFEQWLESCSLFHRLSKPHGVKHFVGGNDGLNTLEAWIGDVVEEDPGISRGVAAEDADARFIAGAVAVKFVGRNHARKRGSKIQGALLGQPGLLDVRSNAVRCLELEGDQLIFDHALVIHDPQNAPCGAAL